MHCSCSNNPPLKSSQLILESLFQYLLFWLWACLRVNVCVCVFACVRSCVLYSIENHVALLLPLVATDVQWQNRDVLAASIDFIYKGERRKGACVGICSTVCACSRGFDCDKQWDNGANMIPVDHNHAHTHTHTCTQAQEHTHTHLSPKVTGALMEPDGRKFSFSWPS